MKSIYENLGGTYKANGNYLTKGTLNQHIAEADTRAEKMFQQLVKSLAEKVKRYKSR